jgi:hypothetical protein
MKNLLLIALILYGGHYSYKNYGNAIPGFSDSNVGFVEVVMPAGKKNGKVYIMAPINCPKDAGIRADSLERSLRDLGIPVERSSSGKFSSTENSSEYQKKFKRVVNIINGEVPAVFISGTAKANPTLDEVIAQYNSLHN